MTESIIQHETFPKHLRTFNITEVQIDLSTLSSVLLSLLIVSSLECVLNMSYLVICSLSIFLSTKTSGVKNLNPLHSVNNFF